MFGRSSPGLFILFVALCFSRPLTTTAQEASTLLTLPEIAITAEKLDWPDLLPQSGEEIPSATLRLRFAPTPNDALRLNPSVSLSGSLKGMAAAPSIRGFSNTSNQILVDGTPVTMPWGNWANITSFPWRNLRRVAVVKGGDSIIYGTGGLAGAVNMGLPTAREMDGLRFFQEMGSQGADHKEVFYGTSGERNEHLFGFIGDYTRGYQRHAQKESNSLFYKGSTTTDSGWNFRLSLLELQGRFELPDTGDPTLIPQTWDQWDFSHRDLVAERSLADGRMFTFRVYRNAESSHVLDYKDFSYDRIIGLGTTQMSTDGGEAILNFAPTRHHRAAIGFQGKRERETDAAVGNIARNLTTNGFFLSDRVEVSPKVGLRLNLRRDEHSVADTETSWSAGADWQAIPKLTLSVTSSRLVRFPAMRELYMTFMGTKNAKGIWSASVPSQGNESNRAEVANATDISCTYRLNQRWLAAVTRFQAQVTDLIDRVNNPNWPKETPKSWWQNINSADLSGWEAKIQGGFGRHWQIWAGYIRQEEADDQATGDRLNDRPQFKVNSGLAWEGNRTSALLFLEKRGTAPYVVFSKGSAVSREIPSSSRLDLSVRRELTRLVSAVISVDNLTDARIEASSYAIGAHPVYETPRRTTVGLVCQF
jgi:outer membrane receptor protein involved in Fe transport